MTTPANPSKILFQAMNALLGAAFLGELLTSGGAGALDAATLVLATVCSILGLYRQLPLQNVLLAALITAVAGGLAHGLSAQAELAMPFGPILFNPAAGGKLFNSLPWTIPLLWIVAILSSRGMARLILRPWRKVRNYGFSLIGLTVALAAAFDLALEPYAWHVRHFWLWQHTKINLAWQGITLLNFAGWLCVSLLIMVLITPSLIRKQGSTPSTPDYHPLLLWLGALLLFAVGAARARLWGPVAVDAALATVTTVFAVRGAKW